MKGTCMHCGQEVDRVETRDIGTLDNPRIICGRCFEEIRTHDWECQVEQEHNR